MESASLLKSSPVIDKSELVKGQSLLRQPVVAAVRSHPVSVSALTIRASSYADEHVKTAGIQKNLDTRAPTMSEIMDSSKAQNLDLQLQTLGPFFRITAKRLGTQVELGRAEGVIRFWFGGKKILHLDSIRLQRETLGMEKSIFGIGLFLGAVAIRHGYENGCNTAQLLAINDTDLYHSKLVRFYTRIGFKSVHEVTGSSIGDYTHMLVWGGVGTRMDANLEDLMIKWCSRFKTKSPVS